MASKALNKPLHPTEDGEVEPNGEVAAADIVQLQKENRELEQQIAEKNKVRVPLIKMLINPIPYCIRPLAHVAHCCLSPKVSGREWYFSGLAN